MAPVRENDGKVNLINLSSSGHRASNAKWSLWDFSPRAFEVRIRRHVLRS
jgi:hypothetical protein